MCFIHLPPHPTAHLPPTHPPFYYAHPEISTHLKKAMKSCNMDFEFMCIKVHAIVDILMMNKWGSIHTAASFLNGMFQSGISLNNGMCVSGGFFLRGWHMANIKTHCCVMCGQVRVRKTLYVIYMNQLLASFSCL